MQMLPKWVLTNPFPAVHDAESLTALEQTARVYGAMNSLITEYNNFADTVNQCMEGFTDAQEEARTDFELKITKVMRTFVDSMDQYMKLNLSDTVTTLINDAIKNGQITVTEVYDPVSESLNTVVGGGVDV